MWGQYKYLKTLLKYRTWVKAISTSVIEIRLWLANV